MRNASCSMTLGGWRLTALLLGSLMLVGCGARPCGAAPAGRDASNWDSGRERSNLTDTAEACATLYDRAELSALALTIELPDITAEGVAGGKLELPISAAKKYEKLSEKGLITVTQAKERCTHDYYAHQCEIDIATQLQKERDNLEASKELASKVGALMREHAAAVDAGRREDADRLRDQIIALLEAQPAPTTGPSSPGPEPSPEPGPDPKPAPPSGSAVPGGPGSQTTPGGEWSHLSLQRLESLIAFVERTRIESRTILIRDWLWVALSSLRLEFAMRLRAADAARVSQALASQLRCVADGLAGASSQGTQCVEAMIKGALQRAEWRGKLAKRLKGLSRVSVDTTGSLLRPLEVQVNERGYGTCALKPADDGELTRQLGGLASFLKAGTKDGIAVSSIEVFGFADDVTVVTEDCRKKVECPPEADGDQCNRLLAERRADHARDILRAALHPTAIAVRALGRVATDCVDADQNTRENCRKQQRGFVLEIAEESLRLPSCVASAGAVVEQCLNNGDPLAGR